MTRKKGGRFDYAKALPEADQKPVPQMQAYPPEPPPFRANPQADQVQPDKTGVLAVPAVQATGSAALLNPSAFALPAQRKGKREDDGTPKRTDVPREQLNVRIRPELKRAAAGLAGLQGKTLGDVVEAALIEYLERAKSVQGE
jgi:hypothetical protein